MDNIERAHDRHYRAALSAMPGHIRLGIIESRGQQLMQELEAARPVGRPRRPTKPTKLVKAKRSQNSQISECGC
jgi:hypothetical protein